MRKFSKRFLVVNGKKYYLVSVKDEYSSRYDPVAFFQKSEERDEFGYKITGDALSCPKRGQLSALSWRPLPDIWLNVPDVCKKCWGVHRMPDSTYNCILRSKLVKVIDKDGKVFG